MCIPKAPKIQPPPPAPELPQAPSEVNPSILAARRRARQQAAASAGFRSTILTSGRGVTSGAQTADPSLIGIRAESRGSRVGSGAVTGGPPITDDEQADVSRANRPFIGRRGKPSIRLGASAGGSGSVVSGGGGGGFAGGGGGFSFTGKGFS